MSIEGQHSYRFGYLKSEQWQTVRIEALAREKAKCQVCGEESLSNDAHHMWYPENIWETRAEHLVILCRPCHDFIHTMVPECKTNDEELGRTNWLKFSNSILAWRKSKILLFGTTDGIKIPNPASLRKRLAELENELEGYRDKNSIPKPLAEGKAAHLLRKIASMISKFSLEE